MNFIENLTKLVDNANLRGAMDLLKSKGISKNFICKASGVDVTGYYKYINGSTQAYGDDKKCQILETIRDLYLDWRR